MSTLESVEGQGAQLPDWPVERVLRGIAITVVLAGASACWAQGRQFGLDDAALQYEADYRVVAARCGTPAFEKKFFMQSQQFVAASNGQDKTATAGQESTIRSLRRNPITLIGSQSDCKVQGDDLKRVMDERSRGRSAQRGRGR